MKRKKREGTKEEKKRKKCLSKPEPARRPPTRVRPARCPKPSRAPFGGRARPFRRPPLRTRAHRGETRAVTGNATPPRGPPRGPGPAPLLPSPTIRAPTSKIQICWCAAGPGFFSRQKTLFSRAAGRTSDGPSPASASPWPAPGAPWPVSGPPTARLCSSSRPQSPLVKIIRASIKTSPSVGRPRPPASRRFCAPRVSYHCPVPPPTPSNAVPGPPRAVF